MNSLAIAFVRGYVLGDVSSPIGVTRRQVLSAAALALAGAAVLAPACAPAPRGEWFYRDNDFDSLAEMEDAHAPILELARTVLARNPGPLLDLGAGNGALVDRLAHEVPGCEPFGVELLPERAAHAREICPRHGANIAPGDMFRCEELFGREYALVLLMPGRLIDGPPEGVAWLRDQLRRKARHLLIYAYQDWLGEYGSLRRLAEAAGLSTSERNPEARAALARVT